MKAPRRDLAAALLWLAARLVPRSRREDWLLEWHGELGSWRAAGRPTGRAALGAFPHALVLARESWARGMGDLAVELRLGLRTLWRHRVFTAAAVSTLALGIGATVAIFSVVHAVLLRPLPYPEGDRLVVLGERGETGGLGTTSFATATDWRERSRSFTHLSMAGDASVVLSGVGDAEQLRGLRVSWDYFDLIGISPALGRGFRDGEGDPSAERVVVLGHGLWQRRFGADPSVIGRPVTLSGIEFLVVGVMPADFEPLLEEHFYTVPAFWTPLRYQPGDPPACRTCRHLRAVARLAPGVSVEQARREVADLTAQLVAEYPEDYVRGGASMVLGLGDELSGSVRPALWVLLGAVGFVLLIACANVSSLLLARGTARRRELAVRAALGAGRPRLVAQSFAECLLLAILGSGLGIALAASATRLLVLNAPSDVPRLDQVGMNGTVVAFAALLTLATTVLAGAAPWVQASLASPAGALKEGGRTLGGPRAHRIRSLLVVGDVAIALVLLAGVGLVLQSFVRVLGMDPGFDPRGVLTMQVNALGPAYREESALLGFHQEVLRQAGELPGVATAGLASQVPFGGNFDRWGVAIEGREDTPEAWPEADLYAIRGSYLEALAIPLLAGRGFDERDQADSPPVALVNERLARAVWRDEDPLGKRVRIGGEDGAWRTIVGVVDDVRHQRLEEELAPQLYLPQTQWASGFMTLVVRASGEPATLAEPLRETVRSIDPGVPLSQVLSLEERVSAATAERRFVLGLLSGFAAVAVLLAMVGLYGVLAYQVGRRTPEIGVRMAVGAGAWQIMRMVLGEGLLLAGTGVALGLLGALLLTRFLSGMLFGVEPTDPATLAGVAALMLGVALLACWLPARRASRLDAPAALAAE